MFAMCSASEQHHQPSYLAFIWEGEVLLFLPQILSAES